MDTVLNWLWQGGVVAVALRLMLLALERGTDATPAPLPRFTFCRDQTVAQHVAEAARDRILHERAGVLHEDLLDQDRIADPVDESAADTPGADVAVAPRHVREELERTLRELEQVAEQR